jgi:hypothetical protein
MNKLLLAVLCASVSTSVMAQSSPAPSDTKVDVTISGGHDTVGADRGRPIVLIAAALKVPDQVFRDAFKGVHPAGPGAGGPTDAEARANKQALLSVLSPYGVTDERLNAVSNYYRYPRWMGAMWKNTPAKAYAIVHGGAVTSVVITDAGSGYSSAPVLSVAGMPNVTLTPTLAYGTDFASNGSISGVKVGP